VNHRTPATIEKMAGLNTDSQQNVVAVYPDAGCMKLTFDDNTVHYQIYGDEFGKVWIGYSTKSQPKAWENAWNVITRKMMKKLEW